jgi:hypothetical protein
MGRSAIEEEELLYEVIESAVSRHLLTVKFKYACLQSNGNYYLLWKCRPTDCRKNLFLK